MKTWFNPFPQNAEWAQKIFDNFVSVGNATERK